MDVFRSMSGRVWMVVACACAIGVALGFFLGRIGERSQSAASSSNQVRADLSEYKFINPLLFSDTDKSTDPAYTKIQRAISSYIDTENEKTGVDQISVYFRDLNSGQWTGVNENDLYTPSSMLKVVAMMAALKLAETDPTLLNETLHFTRLQSSQEKYTADDNLVTGNYSLEKLIEVMIENSDNDAYYAVLSDSRIKNEFIQLYNVFRLPLKGLEAPKTDFMSPKSYSELFRTLYNSSLFEWSLSEQVLNLLSKTTFTDGLVAGVPKGTVVSHKFGENVNELHDCGIVYYPDHPYLLCVMTRGKDFPTLSESISGVSRVVWNAVDAEYSGK